MSNIIIDFIDGAYVLSGDIDVIKNKRRPRSNFEADFSHISFDDPAGIIISFDAIEENAGGKIFHDIEDLLEKFSITCQKTPSVDKFLAKVIQREKEFGDFSEKARNIRNGKHEEDDFKNFVATVEKELKRELYDKQLLSAYHLAFAQNACNFSVPGTGKTAIVYAAYTYLKNLPTDDRKHVGRLLIISPPSAFRPWEDEYQKCFGRVAQSRRLAGIHPDERKRYYFSNNDTEITLTSYQSATLDIDYIKQYLWRHKDVMVVLDEAHRIKNPDETAKWATAIKSIADDARSRVVLTGTPAPNGYEDLWNLYEFIWPHEKIIGFSLPYLANLSDKSKNETDKLVKNIEPFFIRIKKSDLKDLPDPTYNDPINVPMDDQQRKIYNFIEGKYIPFLEANSPIGDLKKARLIRLRQCLTNPALLQRPLNEHDGLVTDDRKIIEAIQNYNSIPPKFVEASNLSEKITKKSGAAGKVVIWAYFIDNIESLAAYLKRRGIMCETLYGATPSDNDDTGGDIRTREKIIQQFHDDDCPYKVIIANPFAVGESISLHKACHNAIYMEKDFNAANYMQSKDRIHRYGLNKGDVVNYYYLLSENSIDKDIHRRVLEKEERMLDIIERYEIPLLEMNMNEHDGINNADIRAIIDGYHARKSTQTAQ